MTDIVITIPRAAWADWLMQHGADDQRGRMRSFHVYDEERGHPPCSTGDQLYVVAHGRLRCVLLIEAIMMRPVTLAGYVPGFAGWRRRWWDPQHELPFPAWRTEAVADRAPVSPAPAALAHGKTPAEQGGSSV